MQGLVTGRFLRRYKRFFSDCRLADGSVVIAHCPNTGSMKTLLAPERSALLRRDDNPRRKLRYTLVFLEVDDGHWALIDTALPNRLVTEAVTAGRVAELRPLSAVRREPRLESRRRFDLFLDDADSGATWVEIKNVTMKSASVAGRADFPDSVTTRGAAHLAELELLARSGKRAVQFYLLGRGDCSRVGIAEEIDPAYAAAVRSARDAGVEFLAYGLDLTGPEPRLGQALLFDFD